MDISSIIFTLFFLAIVLFAIFLIYSSHREDYYEVVIMKLGELAGRVFINEREAIYDYMHFANSARREKKTIAAYKKSVTAMIAYSQKRNDICDDTASKILDIVYEK